MRRLLALLALALLAPPAAAQADVDVLATQKAQTYVVFTAQVMVDAVPDAPVHPALLRLAEDPNLARLTAAPLFGQGTEQVRAEFVFSGVEAFAAWQAESPVRALLAEIGGGEAERVQTATRIIRYPHVQLLDAPGAGGEQ